MRTKRPARAVSDFRYSPLVAALAVAFAPQAAMAVVKTVTDTADTASPGTLRDALLYFSDFENCTGADRIEFQSNGPFITQVSSPLPFITCSGLTIDGTVLPAGTDRAIVQGAFGYGGPTHALVAVSTSPVNVQDLHIEGFNYGAALLGNINAGRNLIQMNLYGYDPSGYSNVAASENIIRDNVHGIRLSSTSAVTISANQVTNSSSRGIWIDSSVNVNVTGNTVSTSRTGIYVSYGGSTVSIDSNAITDNKDTELSSGTYIGIYLEASSAVVNNNHISGNDQGIYLNADQGTKITANKIGVTDDGFEPYANGVGILFGSTGFGAVSSNTEISGNTISANNGYGIDLSDFTGVKIRNNKIGTSLDGTIGMGNGEGGIIAYCGSAIEVSGNVISANSGSAIEFGSVQGGGALNIVGNKIGVQGNGITALGNSSYGVALYFAECGIGIEVLAAKSGRKGLKVLGGSNDLLIRGNSIANNSADGVLVSGGTGNKIVENDIYSNGAKNINLGAPGGPRANDAGDADGGPNNGQNYPVITSVARDWPNARSVVNFTLDTIPGSYRVDAYSNASSAEAGGRIWHGSMQFTAGSGPTAGTIFVTGLTTGNMPNNFTLTATAPFDSGSDAVRGDTSEFSPSAAITPTVAVTVIPNPPILNFGQVPVDSTSPPQTITLLSSGNAPYRITRMGLNTCFGASFYGGPFMISNNCVSNRDYAPGESCQITARFAPLALGVQNMAINACDNTFIYGGRTFTLTGVGGEPPPVNVLPSEFDFGEVLSGSRSAPQQFVVRNPSSSEIAIGPVTVSNGEFVIDSSTCGTSIPGGGLCTAHVTFRPTQPVRSNATLSVTGTASEVPGSRPAVKIGRVKAGSGSASAFLTGLGIQQADITLPPFIDFGAYTLGTPALRQNVVVENVGNAIVSFNTISVSGPFVLGNGCPLNIAPGERCTITLDFSTTTLGNFTGLLSVVSNAIGGTRSIPLTARSVAIPSAQLQVTPNSLSFGDRLLGTTSTTQRVTIRNIGNIPAVITSVTASPDFVVLGNTCSLPLAPTSSCFADVALRPAGFGPRPGSLFVNSNVAGSPNVVGLGGTGCRPFSSSSSRFGMGSGFNCAP